MFRRDALAVRSAVALRLHDLRRKLRVEHRMLSAKDQLIVVGGASKGGNVALTECVILGDQVETQAAEGQK